MKIDGLNMRRMKRLILLFTILLPMSLLAQTTYYVSSSEGNDSNNGKSTDQAWKTLNKVNSFKPSPGDQILFKKGDSWEGTLTPSASGTSGNPITYGAYGSGQKPKIYGSKEITGWELHEGNIYKANISASSINQVFVDSRKQQSARYPNSGYFDITSAKVSSFTSTQVDGGIDYAGAVSIIRTREWYISKKNITKSSNKTFYISSAPQFDLNVGEGFILFNKLDFLDEAGEWYFDNTNNELYLWVATGDDPDNYTVRVSTTNNLVSADSKSNLKIHDLKLIHANEHGIDLNDCSNIIIDNCDITAASNRGIEITSTASNNITISNCTIDGSSWYGIQARGSSHLITDNIITNIGLMDNLGVSGTRGQSGAGIHLQFGSSGGSIVKYNRIKNTGYNGIWFFDNPNTTIEYNYIKNACLTIHDGGGIYCYESSSGEDSDGSIIRYNIIDNVPGNLDGHTAKSYQGDGIYTDDRISNVTIEYNTVSGASHYGLYLHNNKNVIARYNTFYNVHGGYRATSKYGANGNIIEDNTIVNPKGGFAYWLGVSNPSDKDIVSIDKNTYVNHHIELPFRRTDTYKNISFKEWKNLTKFDSNSSFMNNLLKEGESEKLIYNDSKNTKIYNLGENVFKNIKGEKITGTISLEPFTSIILIGTDFNSIKLGNNQSPVIHDQSFEITEDKSINELVAQVVASDPDNGQSLSYSIISGNTNNTFIIDENTGEIFTNISISTSIEQTYLLTVEVTDNADKPLSSPTLITISVKSSNDSSSKTTLDTTKPEITSFAIPETSDSYTVPISTFDAIDNISVTGYLLTVSPDTPLSTDNSWSSTIPTHYRFSLDGTQTIYAWAKDAAGNISTPQNAIVSISVPELKSASSEYQFEETSGLTVFDSKGSNDGTLSNDNLRFDDGVNGKCIQLNGSDYIDLGQCFCQEVTNQITLHAWIKPTATSGDYQGIIMHGGPNIDSHALYIQPSNKLVGFKTTGTTNQWTSVEATTLWDGEWHQLVAVYDGTKKYIYIDGELLYNTLAIGNIESGAGFNFYIGAGRDEADPKLLYQGYIDEVQIHNYALSSSEILDMYNDVINPSDENNSTTQNNKPVARFNLSKAEAHPQDKVSLDASSSFDADGDALTYHWSFPTEISANTDDPVHPHFYAPNVDAETQFTITLYVSDQNANSVLYNQTINISPRPEGNTETNESPIIQNQSFEVIERKSVGDFIAQVIASDPNTNQSLTYSILQGNNDNLFTINSSTGRIRAIKSIQLSSDETYTLKIQVTDNGAEPLSATAFVTLNLIALEVNLSPEIENQQFEISNPKTNGEFIGQIFASDANSEQTLTYSITDGNTEGLFLIDPSTGELKANTDISNSTERTATLIVRVVDNDPYNPLSAYAFVTINIQQFATNQSPVIEDQTFRVYSDLKIGSVVGQVNATDPNSDQDLTYTILSGNEEGLFSINSSNGEITSKSNISIVEDESFTLIVEVHDNGQNQLSSTAPITISLILGGVVDNAEVNNNNPNQVTLVFNKDLEDESLKNAYYNSDFTLSNGKNVVGVIISGNEIILELDSEYQSGDEIIVSYTPGATPIYDASGNPIESFTGYIVDNNIIVISDIDPNSEIDVIVYPNPSSNGFVNINADNLQSDECEVSLYSLAGNLVSKIEIIGYFGKMQERVDISHVNDGTYILRIKCDTQIHQSKLVIM